MALNEVEVAQIRRAGEHFKKVLRETFELFPRSASAQSLGLRVGLRLINRLVSAWYKRSPKVQMASM